MLKDPTIETKPPMRFLGHKKQMSLIEDATPALWQGFAPRIKQIEQRADHNRYSITQYPPNYFLEFNPHKNFVKWAAVAVSEDAHCPDSFESLSIPSIQFAVFIHVGTAATIGDSMQYILERWLPSSGHRLSNAPLIASMGPDYKLDDPNAEEELWIPIEY